jgi:hypothetical protein
VSTNGSNPRLDRIERILDGLAKSRVQDRAEFKREMAESRAEFNREMAEHKRQMDDDIRKTRAELRRASLGVREARNHRKRIAQLEGKSAVYQAHTDQNLSEITDKLNGLIGYVEGLRRPDRA